MTTNDARMKLERSIVRKLIRHLKSKGFELVSVFDGEELVKTKTETDAIDAIFSVDESSLCVRKEGKRYCVAFVAGNGSDIVADHSNPTDDVHGFVAAMDEFQRICDESATTLN